MIIIEMEAKKILLVQLGQIGDLILMTPMFKALKQLNSGNELHLLAGKYNYVLATEHPLIDQVHVFIKRPIQLIQLIQQLRKEKFDIWIDPKDHYSTQSYLLARLSHAKIKVGFNRKDNDLFDHGVASDVQQANKHAVQRNLAALNFLKSNSDFEIQRPILFLKDDCERKLNHFLLQHEIANYHCVNISAASASRYWHTQKWIDFLNYLGERQIRCLVISSPSDIEIANEIVSSTKNCYLYRTNSVIDVFSVVKHSEMTITVDTAVVHIASAFDVPVLALYGNNPHNYIKFHPLSTHHRMVFDLKDHAAIDDISVDLMVTKYLELTTEIKQHSA